MAWAQSDLDNIERAIASGARKVKYQDKEIEYASMDDMIKARAAIRKALGKSAKAQRVYATFDKGLTDADD